MSLAISDFVLPFLEHVPVLRATLAFIFVFFLPGFCWTLVFFSGKQVNTVERVALSFGLSIALVVLVIFLLNRLMGVRITGINSALIILALTIIPVVYYFVKKRMVNLRRDS